MQGLDRAGLIAIAVIVVVTGVFVGISAAHDTGDGQSQDDCEKMHGMDNCRMDGHMGGMMHGTGEECPMDNDHEMHHGSGAKTDCPMQ